MALVTAIKVMNVYESAKILTNVQMFRDCAPHHWNVPHNEHPTDEGHSPEAFGQAYKYLSLSVWPLLMFFELKIPNILK